MKHIFIATVLASVGAAASAQGYVGAVAALSKLSDSCTTGFKCEDSRATGFRFFAGHRFSDAEAWGLGVVRVNRIEVSALRFGRQRSTGTATKFLTDSATKQVPSVNEVSANALVVAVGSELPIGGWFALNGRLGLAYVTASVSSTIDGLSNGSTSGNAIRPYVGVGAEFLLPLDIRLLSSLDWTRYSVKGYSGSATQLGLGASMSF